MLWQFSKSDRWLPLFLCLVFLSGCGFHLQGKMRLAQPLKRMYLQTPDPYGQLSRYLKSALKLSHVQLVDIPSQADTILSIMEDYTTQTLLSVNATTQTRQYEIKVIVKFSIANLKGVTLLPPQILTESRILTMQSNQILGSSNELNLYYQQMRHAIANAIMNRLASKAVTQIINVYQAHENKSNAT